MKGTGLVRRTQSVDVTTTTNQLTSTGGSQAKTSQPVNFSEPKSSVQKSVELTQFPLASTHAASSGSAIVFI